jgi:cytochrome c551/c552
MVKIVLLLLSLSTLSIAASSSFQKSCLSCHQREGIPTGALYKRYLLKYSSKRKIKEVMYHYLKNPSIKQSIMPAPFIHKFGLQVPITLPEKELKNHIETLIKTYDVKKELYIPSSTQSEDKHTPHFEHQ